MSQNDQQCGMLVGLLTEPRGTQIFNFSFLSAVVQSKHQCFSPPFSLMLEPHPTHMRRRGLVSQVGLAPTNEIPDQ